MIGASFVDPLLRRAGEGLAESVAPSIAPLTSSPAQRLAAAKVAAQNPSDSSLSPIGKALFVAAGGIGAYLLYRYMTTPAKATTK